MMEPRPYTAPELLAWCRLLTLTLAGAAMAYTREREGSIDGLVRFAGERLATLSTGTASGGVESAMLGLLLSAQALGGEIASRSLNPEEAEVVAADLPGQRVADDLEDRFEVVLRAEDILELAGVTADDLNRLYDILGVAAAAQGFEFTRESTPEGQRLTLRVW